MRWLLSGSNFSLTGTEASGPLRWSHQFMGTGVPLGPKDSSGAALQKQNRDSDNQTRVDCVTV